MALCKIDKHYNQVKLQILKIRSSTVMFTVRIQ